MCCGRLSVARSRTGDCSDKRNRSCTKWCSAVRDLMQDAYPELKETVERVSKVVLAEETRFAHTLGTGLERLEQDLSEAREACDNVTTLLSEPEKILAASALDFAREDLERDREMLTKEVALGPVYNGAKAFKLYDTFGLPLDFIRMRVAIRASV